MRKATPTKAAAAPSAGGNRAARPASKQTKAAPPARKTNAKSRTADATPPKSTKLTAPPATRQAKKSAPVKGSTPPARTSANRPSTGAARPTGAAKSGGSRPQSAATQPRQPTRDEAAALRSFERAHKEFARGHFAEARNLFRALIEEHAGVSEVTARARTYLSIAESRLRSESALPRDAEALYDRGVIELNRGEYVAAQELFERALRRDDQSPDTHYALAATRARLGSVQSALQSLERALELKPNLRVRAQHDPDLASLRTEPDYERLVFPSRL